MIGRPLRVSSCAEFPNDNSGLHEGVVWVTMTVVGQPRAVLRARATCLAAVADATWPAAIEVECHSEQQVDPTPEPELEPDVEPEPASRSESVVPAAPNDSTPSAFEAFVQALADVLLAAGATRAAAALPVFLRTGKLESPLAEMSRLHGTELAATSSAWRAVLDGPCGDLSACGATTLDRWAAELLAIVLDAPVARTEDLRRDLRRRGVAAFGMLAAA